MTEQIEIAGRKLPIRRTLGAMKQFDDEFKGEISVFEFETKPKRMEHIVALLDYIVQAGFKAEGKPCDVDREWLMDNIEFDEFEAIIQKIFPPAKKQKKT